MKTAKRVGFALAVSPSVLIVLSVTVHLMADWTGRWYWRRGKRVPRVIREAEAVAAEARRKAWRRP